MIPPPPAGVEWRTMNGVPLRVVNTINGVPILEVGSTSAPRALCPDRLRYEQISAADGWRGRLVRVFFWCLRAWPP